MGDHHFEKTASLLAFTLLASLTLQPSDGYAKSSISDIDQQIQQLESKAASAKQEQKKAASNKKGSTALQEQNQRLSEGCHGTDQCR